MEYNISLFYHSKMLKRISPFHHSKMEKSILPFHHRKTEKSISPFHHSKIVKGKYQITWTQIHNFQTHHEKKRDKKKKHRKHKKYESQDPSSSNNSDSSNNIDYRRKQRKRKSDQVKDPIKLCARLPEKFLTTVYKSKIIRFKIDKDQLQRRIYLIKFVESLNMIFSQCT